MIHDTRCVCAGWQVGIFQAQSMQSHNIFSPLLLRWISKVLFPSDHSPLVVSVLGSVLMVFIQQRAAWCKAHTQPVLHSYDNWLKLPHTWGANIHTFTPSPSEAPDCFTKWQSQCGQGLTSSKNFGAGSVLLSFPSPRAIFLVFLAHYSLFFHLPPGKSHLSSVFKLFPFSPGVLHPLPLSYWNTCNYTSK